MQMRVDLMGIAALHPSYEVSIAALRNPVCRRVSKGAFTASSANAVEARRAHHLDAATWLARWARFALPTLQRFRRFAPRNDGHYERLMLESMISVTSAYTTYCAMPLPNDQFSFTTSMKFTNTSSGRRPGRWRRRSTSRA